MPENIRLDQGTLKLTIFLRVTHDSQKGAICVNHLNGTPHNTDTRIGFHERYLLSEAVSYCNVVGIHSRDVLTASKPTPPVQRRNEAHVRLAKKAYSFVTALI